jgi:hypothetical protein
MLQEVSDSETGENEGPTKKAAPDDRGRRYSSGCCSSPSLASRNDDCNTNRHREKSKEEEERASYRRGWKSP